jgi:hypothetical protein
MRWSCGCEVPQQVVLEWVGRGGRTFHIRCLGDRSEVAFEDNHIVGMGTPVLLEGSLASADRHVLGALSVDLGIPMHLASSVVLVGDLDTRPDLASGHIDHIQHSGLGNPSLGFADKHHDHCSASHLNLTDRIQRNHQVPLRSHTRGRFVLPGMSGRRRDSAHTACRVMEVVARYYCERSVEVMRRRVVWMTRPRLKGWWLQRPSKQC